MYFSQHFVDHNHNITQEDFLHYFTIASFQHTCSHHLRYNLQYIADKEWISYKGQ